MVTFKNVEDAELFMKKFLEELTKNNVIDEKYKSKDVKYAKDRRQGCFLSNQHGLPEYMCIGVGGDNESGYHSFLRFWQGEKDAVETRTEKINRRKKIIEENVDVIKKILGTDGVSYYSYKNKKINGYSISGEDDPTWGGFVANYKPRKKTDELWNDLLRMSKVLKLVMDAEITSPQKKQSSKNFLDQIKEKMGEHSKTLEFVKQRPDFLQYRPANADSKDWFDGACHYEFLKEEEKIHICFHCEHLFPHREKLKQLIEKENFKWTKRRTSINYLDISLNEPDVVTNAVNAMLDFVEKHGSLFEKLIKESKGEKMENGIMTECVELLKNNHNIILHGAPGTGKTYLAKQIAKEMIFGKNKLSDEEEIQLKEQRGFVQFHQSYDYTDFVEGLRPDDQNKEQIGFIRKNGVFKEFCNKALTGTVNKSEGDFSLKLAYESLIDKIKNEEMDYFKQKEGKEIYIKEITSKKNIKLQSSEAKEKEEGAEHIVSYKRLKKLIEKYKDSKSFDDMSNIDKSIRNVIGGCNSSAYWAVAKYLLKETEEKSKQTTEKKYVFIIDEINRGEMSKIFGELFYSVDPGYRGREGIIQTQYQNLVLESDPFSEGFFVPKNVYIIGTMNDIDRSVESMDFAMRRRFAFKEIFANQSQEMFGDGKNWINGSGNIVDVSECLENIKKRMDNLNNAILDKKINLGSSYQIGGAYFLKFANYYKVKDEKTAFEKLWDNHLKCILREYLRGMSKSDDLLQKLKDAYDLKTSYNENGEVKKETDVKPEAAVPA